MQARLLLGGLVACLVADAGAQTTVFKGRLIVSAGGPPVTQMRVNLGPANGIAPRADGQFSAAVPAGVRSLLITVDTGNDKWQAWHPRLPVAVSLDTSVVTEILVGPSVEESVRRGFVAMSAQLRGQLTALGVTDSVTQSLLRSMSNDLAARANVPVEDLTAAASLGEKRAELFPVLAGTVETYLLKLQNVHLAFQYVAGPAFSNDSAFAQLKGAILAYNPALEALKAQHEGFEHSVREFWDSERLAGDYRALVDYALSEIHDAHILPLNPIMSDIDAVLKGRARGPAAARSREDTMSRIRVFLSATEPRIAEFARRKTRLLAQLQTQ
jgi:hypothetical protein